MQACFKLLAALLRECPDYAPPLPLLRHVMRSAFADIAAAPSALFGLLRAVLSRKLLEVVEVYDVMKRVQVRPPPQRTSPVTLQRSTARCRASPQLHDFGYWSSLDPRKHTQPCSQGGQLGMITLLRPMPAHEKHRLALCRPC